MARIPYKEMTLARLRSELASKEKLIALHESNGNHDKAKRFKYQLNQILFWENIRRDEVAQKNPKETKKELSFMKGRFDIILKEPFDKLVFDKFIVDLRKYLQNK